MSRSARPSESKNLVRPPRPPGSSAPAPVARARRHVYLSVEERVARGKAARQQAPRSSHRKWEQATDRLDPVALLEEQCETRVPELVPIRNGRMLASPFTFFRGAALIMAADLASTPRSGVNVQLCGDAHLSNFGVFGSPERQLMFDINDFDETLPGPWEWDVKRLAASCEILGRDRGFAASDRRAIVRAGVAEYRNVMRRAANMGTLDVWYDHLDIEEVLDWVHTEAAEGRIGKKEAKEAEEDVAKARTRDSTRVFAKRADEVDGKLRIVADPPLVVPFDDLTDPGTTRDEMEKQIRSSIQKYRRSLSDHHHPIEEFEYVHSARKIVGVGSVGTRAWIHLFVGRDDQDPLFLQSKEAEASVLERFVGKSEHAEHGQSSCGGSTVDASGQRHLPRLVPCQSHRRPAPPLLRAPAPRLEGRRRRGELPGAGGDALRPAVRSDARPRACTLGRPNRDRVVPGQRQRVRQGDRRLRRRVRRPERT